MFCISLFVGKKIICLIIWHLQKYHIKQKIRFYSIMFNLHNHRKNMCDSCNMNIQSHKCQITVHKINIQCVNYFHWCKPDNILSLNTREWWTMHADHYSISWLLQGPFPPAMLVHLAMSIINFIIFHPKCAQLVWDMTDIDNTLIFCCTRKSLTTRAPCGQAFIVLLKCDGVSPSWNDWNSMFLLISSRCCMPVTSMIFKDVRPLAVCKVLIHQKGKHK